MYHQISFDEKQYQNSRIVNCQYMTTEAEVINLASEFTAIFPPKKTNYTH